MVRGVCVIFALFAYDPVNLAAKGTPSLQSYLLYSGFLSIDLQPVDVPPSSSRILGEQGGSLVYFQEWNIEDQQVPRDRAGFYRR